ncbi:YigZ family protein [Gemella sp. zg-570]|uniref:YigZ family protein n=1 Tax=Gemella sp. zg-570 TaxID=2840371 RepID=UPI001C0CF9FF|nr:YigZ family protein [Gemella sp. zg-570]QWQ38502.1 YigZ family protein [Gemella sp. zg-570]
MTKKFITIKNNVDNELIEKKSRFITYLIRISSQEEAKEFIQKMKKKFYDASHVCSAFVFGDNNEITRANDDGEPSGTAGTPMLDVLLKNNIKNVCAVSIRYFGGTKLGTGGLVRAYSSGLIEAIKKAKLIERKNALEINFEIEYSLNGKIEYEITKTNFLVDDVIYSDKINYKIFVIKNEDEVFLNWIREATNGKFKIISSREKLLEFDIK